MLPHCLIRLSCTFPVNYHSALRPRSYPSKDRCLITMMSEMNAIKLKRCSISHEKIKMTSRTHEIFTVLKAGRCFTKVALERRRQCFISVSGLFHTFPTDFLFIYNWRESHTVHSPRCIPYHTQHYYCCCLNSILSGACVFFFFPFHIQCCLFFLVRLVIFRWNIIARIFSVLWEFHTLSSCLIHMTSPPCLLVPLSFNSHALQYK